MLKQLKYMSFSSLRHIISKEINKTVSQDRRIQGKCKISLHDILLSGLACMFYQDSSLLEFQRHLSDYQHSSNLHSQFNITNIPSDTQMRDVLDNYDPGNFMEIFNAIFSKFKKSNYLSSYESPLGGYLCSMDGTQYYGSHKIKCDHCLVANKVEGKFYSHRALQAAIVNPDKKTVIPLMPVEIANNNYGYKKQDCERKSAFRMLELLKNNHKKLPFIILGDALYAETPFFKDVLSYGYNYIVTSKPRDNKYIHDEFSLVTTRRSSLKYTDKYYRHCYRWANNLPFTGNKNFNTNIVFYEMQKITKNGEYTTTYKTSFVTSIEVTKANVKDIVKSGRCRWKIENECFNNLKNHGYNLEHNYGHGSSHLGFNFFVLTILAFWMHQILEQGDELYQSCRKKFGSKKHLWSALKHYIRILIFKNFEDLLSFALTPTEYEVRPRGSPD